MKNTTATTVLSSNSYHAVTYSREHEMKMNRPTAEGGDNSAATPIEYLLTAIGGCVSMTLRVFAKQKGWDLGEIRVNVKQKNKLTLSGLITSMEEEISFENAITEVQRKELLIAAGKCPVVQLLKNETHINSKII